MPATRLHVSHKYLRKLGNFNCGGPENGLNA
jgi:hypothetical protein